MKSNVLFLNILQACKGGLRFVDVHCSSKNLLYLSLLSSLNAIEYSKVANTANKYRIRISYYRGNPVLKDVIKVSKLNSSINLKQQQRESNSKRAIYITQTNMGLKITYGTDHRFPYIRYLYRVIL